MPRYKLLGTSFLSLFLFLSCLPIAVAGEDGHPLAGIPLRSIGPALTSGRVSDFAFHPDQWQVHYVAFASGNLWKTENNGISWKPLFENEGSYSIGVVELDPANPNTVWVGTGENNAQRSVAFGDGVAGLHMPLDDLSFDCAFAQIRQLENEFRHTPSNTCSSAAATRF